MKSEIISARHARTCSVLLILATLSACCRLPAVRTDLSVPHKEADIMADDIHSHGSPRDVRTTHLDFDWDVDFGRKILTGSVTCSLHRGNAEEPLVLDVQHLNIQKVEIGRGGLFEAAAVQIQQDDVIPGDALVVPLGSDTDVVRVHYETTLQGTGFQWLDPVQTASGKYPFLFSQAQSVHARTMFPCQDSPGVRVTWSASIRVPDGLTAVMSGDRSESDEQGVFRFEMSNPVPPYLIAVAVGELAYLSLGDRTGVWAAPSVVEKAAWEFADTEKMIATVEELYGPYRWGVFEILVLPPSFPFGGMENPKLTFATPTILAGDRSLVSLVAHELAHSWSGNLVTNATWSDFWLNEGFTVYLERRIMEALFGEERYRMEAMLGLDELEEEMAGLAPADEVLHVDLTGRDPDEGFTNVPYEKGAAFLTLLEKTFGRERFDKFLRGYFDAHAFQSMTTAAFREWMQRHLFDQDREKAALIDVDGWLEKPGLPADCPRVSSDAFERVDAQLQAWKGGTRSSGELETAAWTTHEWLHFLRGLKDDRGQGEMAALDQALMLSKSQNSEITCAWLQASIEHDHSAADGRLREFLTEQGRRKFLKPLYRALWKKGGKRREQALEIYEAARPLYHAISQGTLDEILGFDAR